MDVNTKVELLMKMYFRILLENLQLFIKPYLALILFVLHFYNTSKYGIAIKAKVDVTLLRKYTKTVAIKTNI